MKKIIKAWAIVDSQNEMIELMTSRLQLFSSEKVAERNARVLGDKVLPCTISFTTPKKK